MYQTIYNLLLSYFGTAAWGVGLSTLFAAFFSGLVLFIPLFVVFLTISFIFRR